jgi:hypothetical protein
MAFRFIAENQPEFGIIFFSVKENQLVELIKNFCHELYKSHELPRIIGFIFLRICVIRDYTDCKCNCAYSLILTSVNLL